MLRLKHLISVVAISILAFPLLSGCATGATPTPTVAPTKASASAPTAAPAQPTAAVPTPAPTKPAASAPTAAPAKPEVREVEKLRIGVGPFTNHAAMYAADKLGYFKDEGLTVELQTIAFGQSGLTLVEAGKLEFSGTDFVGLMLGRSQGFDFTPVIPNQVMKKEPPLGVAMLVKPDSPIKAPKDLEGKRIATTAMKNSLWLTGRAYVKKNGGDPEKLKWTELSYANMADALTNNQIDVAYMVEPFITPLVAAGKARILASPFHEFEPALQLAFWVSSEKWIKANPIATKKFYRAVSRAYEFLNNNPAERKKYILEWTKTDPALFDKLIPDGAWDTTINTPMLQRSADLMVEHGVLKEKIDVSKFVYKP